MNAFKKTLKQIEAGKLLASDIIRYFLLYGGSRSGKTFFIIRAMIIRASKIKSRHAILRLKFNHVKTSIWLDTLPKVFRICFPTMTPIFNKSDYFVSLQNGSEIWVAGLDDDTRVEKILGKEYSTMFFNECSQIPYKSIEVALTRLAEKNSLKKKAYFDMNPPTKRHWSFSMWFKFINPKSQEPLDSSRYGSIKMNPQDNIENIDEEYISEILDKLSPEEKKRFRDGEFAVGMDGMAYSSFDRALNVHEIEPDKKQGPIMVGMDFNVNPMTAVIGYRFNNKFYVVDEIYFEGDTPKMCMELKRRGYGGAIVYPDSTGKKRTTSGRSDHLILESNGFKIVSTHNPYVRDRVNNSNRLLADGSIVISPNCVKLIDDLEQVIWKDGDLWEGKEKMLTHISDALGYWTWALDNMVFKTPSKIELR